MSTVTSRIEVDVPIHVAYNQWTQFEEFPSFMEGVEEVRQLDDTTLQWRVEIAGAEREFVAQIDRQEPDNCVAWSSSEGVEHSGVVSFERLGPEATEITLQITYEPSAWTEKVADALNLIGMRAEGDLVRFKDFIEARGVETGAWRGAVEDGQATDPGTPPPTDPLDPTLPPPTDPLDPALPPATDPLDPGLPLRPEGTDPPLPDGPIHTPPLHESEDPRDEIS